MTEHAAADAKHYRWDDMTAEPLKGGITRKLITGDRAGAIGALTTREAGPAASSVRGFARPATARRT